MAVREMLSVGVDIGTSTTQIIFSRLSVENAAGYFSVPRIAISDKRVVYRSGIYTTPLFSLERIDSDGVQKIVEKEYMSFGCQSQDVETGAVIITGESARKENAAAVLEKLSGFAGDFVVSTAGPDLESILAGKGSGAWRQSMEKDCVVVNLDIGGGTTNLVAFDGGETVSTGCLDIGGRLIRVSEDLKVESVSPAARAVAEDVGVPLCVGERTSAEALSRITDRMADLIARAVGILPEDGLLRRVRTPGSSWFSPPRRIRYLCFSGGVADCMSSEREDAVQYGDIGVLLGRSIKNNGALGRIAWLDAAETIRATVVGAGTYTTSVSGSTVSISQQLLPIKNLPVLRLTAQEEQQCFDGESGALAQRLSWFQRQCGSEQLALAMTGLANPDYRQLKLAAGAIARAWEESMPSQSPILILLERDMAKALGFAFQGQTHRPVLVLDDIVVKEGDYIDLGQPVVENLAVPVVVKTLIFG